jgi:hypothetical protein
MENWSETEQQRIILYVMNKLGNTETVESVRMKVEREMSSSFEWSQTVGKCGFLVVGLIVGIHSFSAQFISPGPTKTKTYPIMKR